MRYTALLLVLAMGCDGGEPEEEAFLETSTSNDPDFDTCTPDVYWPAGLFPLVVDQITPPAPPYEITHVSAGLFDAPTAFDGRDCSPEAGLHVLVWQADGTEVNATVNTDALTIEADALVDVVIGAPNGDDGWVLGTVALDPPIRVETAGALWIGMDAQGDTGSGPGACLAGCGEIGDGYTAANAPDYEWGSPEVGLPMYQLTFAHD